MTLDPELESQISTMHGTNGVVPEPLSGSDRLSFQAMLRQSLERLLSENRQPILLTKSSLRLAVLRLAKATVPDIVVLGQEELTADLEIRSVGIVGLT